MPKPAGNSHLWGISPYLHVSVWLLRFITHNPLALPWSSPFPSSPSLLPSNPKLADILLVHTSSSGTLRQLKLHSQVLDRGRHFPLLFSGLPDGEGLLFATPSGHAAAEVLQVQLLRGAVERSHLTAPDPRHPARAVCCHGNSTASFKPLQTSA